MTSSELTNKITSAGLYPICVWMTEKKGESKEFQFIGSLDEYLAAVKVIGATAIFFSVTKMDEDDFVYEPEVDDSDQDGGESEFSPERYIDVDLVAVMPVLASFKKYIGQECQFVLTATSPQGILEFDITEKWWDDFYERRQNALDKVKGDRDAAYERVRADRAKQQESLFSQIRGLIDDDEVCRMKTQRAITSYALEKFPKLEDADKDRLKDEIQKLYDKVERKRKK